MKKACLGMAAALGLAAGCAGPSPAQTRVSLLTWYAPKVVIVLPAGAATNAPAADAWTRADGDANTQTLAARQRGVLVALDNQLAFPVGSGAAASNSVLSGIEIPLVK